MESTTGILPMEIIHGTLILEHTTTMSDLVTNWDNPPFSVIDMGWSVKPAMKSSDPVAGETILHGAMKISGICRRWRRRSNNMVCGPVLWTRPLLANANDNPSYADPYPSGPEGPERKIPGSDHS